MSLDNIEGELRSALLCQMLTQNIVKVRLFGQNKETFEFPSIAFVVANGNNMIITKDLTERSLLCRLDAKMELPGSRKFDWDPVEVVRVSCPKYVRLELTILRAYAVAGYPKRRSRRWADLRIGATKSARRSFGLVGVKGTYTPPSSQRTYKCGLLLRFI